MKVLRVPSLVLFSLFSCVHFVHAQGNGETVNVFGPEVFFRSTGKPETVRQSFTLPPMADGPYVMVLINGDADGGNRVSSAVLLLNGELIIGPSDFDQQAFRIEREVFLLPDNILEVELKSGPGSKFVLRIFSNPIHIDADGGVVIHPSGVGVRIPPQSLDESVIVNIEPLAETDLPVSIPSGSAFLGALRLDLSGAILSVAADVAIPAPTDIPADVNLLVVQVVDQLGLDKLTLIDTASVVNGLLVTNSPPFPGVLSGGQIAFIGLTQAIQVIPFKASTMGVPAQGAAISLQTASFPEGTPLDLARQVLEVNREFVGLVDHLGFTAFPGGLAGSLVSAIGININLPEIRIGQITIPSLPFPSPDPVNKHSDKASNSSRHRHEHQNPHRNYLSPSVVPSTI